MKTSEKSGLGLAVLVCAIVTAVAVYMIKPRLFDYPVGKWQEGFVEYCSYYTDWHYGDYRGRYVCFLDDDVQGLKVTTISGEVIETRWTVNDDCPIKYKIPKGTYVKVRPYKGLDKVTKYYKVRVLAPPR